MIVLIKEIHREKVITSYVRAWCKRGISKMLRARLMQTRSLRDSFCETVCHAAT